MDDSNDLFARIDDKPQPVRTPARPVDPLVEAARNAAAAAPVAPTPARTSPVPPAPTLPAPIKDPGSYSAADIEVLEGLEPVRRRPGMYIGGTDEKALHHLFAEVIDNSMDEAVAGHATFIEVELSADGFLSVTDNGRGIPVDLHPKYNRPAVEVIMTTLHSGGKFDSKVYETSGGLHGVGVSVVNALSEELEVEIAVARKLYRQRFSRGKPLGDLEHLGDIHNRRGTKISFRPDEQIFGKGAKFDPARLYKMARSKAYLFGGVQIRWSCDPLLIGEKDDTPPKAEFHYPGGLRDYLAASLNGDFQVTREIFAGKSERQGGHGSVEWAVTVSSIPTAIRSPPVKAAPMKPGFATCCYAACAPMQT
jgi:topoisomerase-4 subunit B